MTNPGILSEKLVFNRMRDQCKRTIPSSRKLQRLAVNSCKQVALYQLRNSFQSLFGKLVVGDHHRIVKRVFVQQRIAVKQKREGEKGQVVITEVGFILSPDSG